MSSLFQSSVVKSEFDGIRIDKFGDGGDPQTSIIVYCRIELKAYDPKGAERVGWAFLGGLQNQHGHSWLGPFIINIQNVKFTGN